MIAQNTMYWSEHTKFDLYKAFVYISTAASNLVSIFSNKTYFLSRVRNRVLSQRLKNSNGFLLDSIIYRTDIIVR